MIRFSFMLTAVFGLSAALLQAQSPDLASLHSSLTTDCKSIRGHAARIVAEASETEMNTDVALAHLREVMRYQTGMEQHLKSSHALLTTSQRKAVEAEQKALETICATIKDLAGKAEKEFAGAAADRRAIRGLATTMRNEMTRGKDIHDLLKKKLGIP